MMLWDWSLLVVLGLLQAQNQCNNSFLLARAQSSVAGELLKLEGWRDGVS
jgi:hypothetical protein